MVKKIKAVITSCRHGQPLVVLESEPFNGLEASTDQLRAMAEALNQLANRAQNHVPRLGRKFVTVEVEE
jgi:hypothetical protein